ncbi:hypothetical protein COS52_04305 [Candidatus Roizmanbacteria bacterium CG03_land_8_20_14_0_80_39_12]|uniref:Antitoxin n=1 Tax=Candidatus Roizmanbacteria bacterium CG03_land_8_20_14_0_80_39_12 TaxID=1974847 RepID=A0A2M7BRM1_9BACT|nr:MAG: hypothetical protein COS52_04305 [Candidatus Roizmanbacteria bacterium CG03_land_8_20_14_0_80_39_12]
MLNTVSAKQIQRGYKKIFEQAKSDNKPIVVITNNKPVGAIISIHLLDKLNKNIQLELLEKEAVKEYKKGHSKSISTSEELQDFFNEIRQAAK